MFEDLKLAYQSFKKNWMDYLAISFVFGVITFIGFLVGQSILGLFLAYVLIAIPAIISLKFCAFQSYNKTKVEYRSLKIGFMTFFKSIKIYFLVILKPLLWSLFGGIVCYSIFMSSAINMASETLPNIMNELANYETTLYAYNEMLKIDNVRTIMQVGVIVSLILGLIIYFVIKLKRDFIPFIAFEMPITSKRAIAMNEKVLKGKYVKFLISNLLVELLYIAPIALSYLTFKGLSSNAIYSSFTITAVTGAVMLILSSPITTFKQLHYIHCYKTLAKPYKEDFDNELKNVIKEIEALQKMIDKNNEK